jgi:hypothetical protein
VTVLKRVGSIEIDQHLDHARAAWRVQRVGWTAMVLLMLAGLLGLFGDGPLAYAHARANGLTLEYDRFARHGATSYLAAQIAPAALRGDSAKLWLTQKYLDGIDLESVAPEPQRVEMRGDVVLFTFVATDRSRPARITFTMRPNDFWSRSASAGLDGGDSVSFRQFIYP